MSEFQASRFVFRWALWRVAGRGYREKKITKDDRKMIRSVVSNPKRDFTFMGSQDVTEIDLCDILQASVEAKAIQEGAKTGRVVSFDWFSLIAILLEMLPMLLDWIKDLLDRLDDADGPFTEE